MRAEQRSGAVMAAPYTAFLLIFALYPILFALALVFMKWDLVTTPSFAGFDNIRMLANDGRFWRAATASIRTTSRRSRCGTHRCRR